MRGGALAFASNLDLPIAALLVIRDSGTGTLKACVLVVMLRKPWGTCVESGENATGKREMPESPNHDMSSYELLPFGTKRSAIVASCSLQEPIS